jgi:hypothetical protein
MGQFAHLALAAVAVLPVSGCGTICNFGYGFVKPDEAPSVYGGFGFDMKVFESVASEQTQSLNLTHGNNGYLVLFIAGLFCADPVLSLTADTLTLPITLYLEDRRARAHARDHEGQAPAALSGPQPDQEFYSSAVPSRPAISDR